MCKSIGIRLSLIELACRVGHYLYEDNATLVFAKFYENFVDSCVTQFDSWSWPKTSYVRDLPRKIAFRTS